MKKFCRYCTGIIFCVEKGTRYSASKKFIEYEWDYVKYLIFYLRCKIISQRKQPGHTGIRYKVWSNDSWNCVRKSFSIGHLIKDQTIKSWPTKSIKTKVIKLLRVPKNQRIWRTYSPAESYIGQVRDTIKYLVILELFLKNVLTISAVWELKYMYFLGI